MTMMMIKISSFHFPTECHFPPPGRLLPYYYSVRTCYHSRSPPAPISHGNNNLGYRRYPPAKFGSSATRTSKASPKDIEISCSDGLFSEVFGEAARNDGIDVVIEETGTNQRTIRSKVVVNASLDTVWNVLTDYERLPDFIPGLTVSQLLQKQPNFARLFQIGEQTFLFGLKLDAKGVIDCYEKELQILPHGRRRDIYFKMIEGDFQVFEGKWSVEQFVWSLSYGCLYDFLKANLVKR
ncbi:unnamed protein product [Cuscuta europaea]|uniref:Coenzyme Q-binding protein COQ10 START domain-containing protein n=1 Tax=Cuscuta europaea TaxID=41803 RepID=A0A9P0YXP6_CUSEU|nr:unnamed protein product [Cuscuta europaea]